MNKVNSNYGKDGLIVQRARKTLGVKEVYTLKTVHIQIGGQCLCGFKGQLYNDTNLNVDKMPKCGRCQNRLEAALDAQVKVENRNYWLNPEHGGVKLEVTPRKSVPKYTQPMLPDELLPTGTGRLLREDDHATRHGKQAAY